MSEIAFGQAAYLSAYGTAQQLPQSERPELVFSGRSNVGKSSLINKLCNRKSLARVSATPGKTATINFYDLGGICFVDLPGYGYAKTSFSERKRWDELINGYFSQPRNIPLLVQLLDCRHEPSQADRQMLEYLDHYNIPFVAALSKTDKLKPAQRTAAVADFEAFLQPYASCRGVYATSAEKGWGIEELQAALQAAVDDYETGQGTGHGLQ